MFFFHSLDSQIKVLLFILLYFSQVLKELDPYGKIEFLSHWAMLLLLLLADAQLTV